MKTYLRQLGVATFVFLLAVTGAVAQTTKPTAYKFNEKRTFEALKISLESSNVPGFVESALYTVAECKNRYPNFDYSGILKVVDRVAQRNNNPAIRYKAYLVSMYLTHAPTIQVTPITNADSHEYLFKQIADQLEQRFLAYDGVNPAEGNR
jgi:hypothetical protein